MKQIFIVWKTTIFQTQIYESIFLYGSGNTILLKNQNIGKPKTPIKCKDSEFPLRFPPQIEHWMYIVIVTYEPNIDVFLPKALGMIH